MRNLKLELENLNREMCKLVIQQADIDEQLKKMDREARQLQRELDEKV